MTCQFICVQLFLWSGLLFISSHSVTNHLGACQYTSEAETDTTKEENATFIYFLSLLPYPQPVRKAGGGRFFQPVWDGGPSVVTAAQLAVQDINKDPNTLPGVSVKLINAESGCNETNRAVVSFIRHIFRAEKPRKQIVGVIGPACSESAIAISSLATRAGLALPIVHIALSAELEDRRKYPHTFGVVGSTLQTVQALLAFIRHNQWKEVALLYDDARRTFYTSQQTINLIQSELVINERVIVFDSTIYNNFFPFDSLQSSNAKVIAIAMDLELARKIMCIAHDRQMAFPKYQWIIVGYSYSEFAVGTTTFHYSGKMYDCNWTDSRHPEASVLEHQLFMHFRLQTRSGNDSPLVSGQTYQQTVKSYLEYLNISNNNMECPFSIVPNVWASSVYDAVWTLAQALNSATTDVYFVNDTLKESFQQVSFNGSSGLIQFNMDTGFVQRHIDVDQISNGVPNLVGSIINQTVTLKNASLYTPPKYQYETVSGYLAGFCVLIEAVLLIATILVHVVTIVNRKSPSVKASSPALNQFFFFGCYTLCVVAIVYILIMKALPLANNVVSGGCHSFLVWLVPIAITLTFGTLAAKTWRIYRIFIHFREPGPLISNKALITIVLLQLAIDIIIGIAWSIVSPITLDVIYKLAYVNGNGDMIVPRQCIFTNTPYWIIILVLYKSLQIFCLFVLYFLTRSIKNNRFSTVSLSIASYLGLLFITVLIPLYFILWYTNAAVEADFVVLCTFFSGNGFVFLVFVLIPPIFPLLANRYKFKFSLPP